MAEKMRVILDTDILIKAYRGDESKIKNLILLKDQYCISVITAIELINGANTFRQLASFNKVLRIYSLIQISENISLRAYKIFRQYTLSTILDWLIALLQQRASNIICNFIQTTKKITIL